MAAPEAYAVSAPGKVLLTGGYLVLDRQHTGLVFGLDARIHAHIRPAGEATDTAGSVVVRSPQFEDAVWRYSVKWHRSGRGVEVQEASDPDLASSSSPNPFVEAALVYALSYVYAAVPTEPARRLPACAITVLADDDYYSRDDQPQSQGRPETKTQRAFQNFGKPLSEVHKTGLGSSAALVVAVVTAIYLEYGSWIATSNEQFQSDDLSKLHTLAQAAHCTAQGKVGSGFDVASAVYGSCLYRRFTPAILEGLPGPETAGFGQALVELVKSPTRMDHEIDKSTVVMPPGLRLVMCDVDTGSQTPGMVKKLLAWRAANRVTADALWASIQKHSDLIAAELSGLHSGRSEEDTLLRENIQAIRADIRQMSQLAQVPIEPPAQTRLLDACTALPGVIGGVVPGAGGYDAVALLVKDTKEAMSALEEVLGSHRFEGDGTAASGTVRALGVKQDFEGVRVERAASYHDWV